MKFKLKIILFNLAFSQTILAQEKTFVEYLTPLRWSLGGSVSANILAGGGLAFEFLNFGESGTEVASYCAPSAGFISKVEVGASASIIKPMGYYQPEDYSGYALNIGVNLPFKFGSIQYTFGSSFNQALDILEKQKKYGDFEPAEIAGELGRFIRELASADLSVQQKNRILAITCHVSDFIPKFQKIDHCENQGLVSFTNLELPAGNLNSASQAKTFSDWIQADYTAMYNFLKELARKKVFAKKAPNFQKLYSAIVKTISQTGSISISVGTGFAPYQKKITVSGMMSVSHYHLIQKSSSVQKKIDRLLTFEPKQIALNFLEQYVDATAFTKSMATLCWPSTKILSADVRRLYKILVDPQEDMTRELNIDSYFTLK